jgi:hypothetical protein
MVQNTAVPKCDLSVVVTTRNDDHGGDMLRRFKIFAEALLEQANRHSLTGELIVVEWNPPPGPRLSEIVKLAVTSDSFAIRFLEVPPEAHGAIRNSDVIPLFQMSAKNVGLRRARGEFILATNPDILFSDGLVSFMASGKLDSAVMYRIDRHDVPAEVPDTVSPDQQLDWCNSHVLRIHRKRGSFPPPQDFLRRFRKLRPRHIMQLLTKLGVGVFDARRLLRRILWGALYFVDPLPKIHTNGCGDFTLMSKDRWLALRGYPELPIWSMHIDSLLCYMAIASGLHENVLRPPAKIFHMEHRNSWVVMTPDDRLRTFSNKPWLDIGLLSELWQNMYRSHRPVAFNDAGWGLGSWSLDETIIVSGKKRFIRKGTSTLGLAGVG